MNEKQKQRFWELRGKKSLTSSQREELVLLEEKALKAGLSLDDLEPATSESQLTENELAEIVKSAVEDQVFGLREEILDEVKKAGGKEELEEIVKKYSNQLDSDDLLDKLNEKVEASKTDVEALTEAFKSAVADMKLDSKMVHANSSKSEDAPLIEMPFGNSKESLTVAQKQLHNVLLGKDMNQDIPESSLKIAQDRGEARYKAQYKAIGNVAGGAVTDASHLGRVNQDLSSQLQESFYGDSALARALIASEINMPTNPFKLPVVTSRPTFNVAGEGTSATSTDIGTANVTLDTAKLIGMSEYTYEIDEDSVLAILPVISSQLSKAAASAFESAVINGDVQGNPARDNFAAGAAETAFEGIRKITNTAGAEVDFANAAGPTAFNLDSIGAMRAAMGVYGLNPSDLLLVLSPSSYNALILETEVEDASSFGRPGTLQTGVLPRVYGITVIPTAEIPNVMSDNGAQLAPAAGDATVACLVHKPSWFVGVKRGFTVETDQNKINQTNQVIASFRRDFKPIEAPQTGRLHSVTGVGIAG